MDGAGVERDEFVGNDDRAVIGEEGGNFNNQKTFVDEKIKVSTRAILQGSEQKQGEKSLCFHSYAMHS